MNIKHYKMARGYAYALAPNKANYKDLLHDAYIRHYDKTGENLFDCDPRFIAKAIKYRALGEYNKNKFMKNGNNYRVSFVYIGEGEEEFNPKDENNLMNSIENYDIFNKTQNLLNNTQKSMLNLHLEGYDKTEIADKLDTTRYKVTVGLDRAESLARFLL